MNDPTLDKDDTKTLIDNLQQSNKLIRARVLVMTFFLVLMMGFSISIEQNKKELVNLDRSYLQLQRLLQPDSMKAILTHDSLAYLYKNGMGAYMSLEVLYDKLAKDSFQNREPVYAAIDKIDDELQIKKRDMKEATVTMFGFSIPIHPIMMLGPVLILLLYHDFSVIMLYRKNLEDKMRLNSVEIWRSGPEAVGHYMLDFIPHKFRYVKWIWGVIQIVLLFIPIVPAIYFCLYTLQETDLKLMVLAINLSCCLLILLNFLIMIDSENILGVRDTSLIFAGKKETAPSSKFLQRRKGLALCIPTFLGAFTAVAFLNTLGNNIPALLACVCCSLLAGSLLSIFTILNTHQGIKRGKLWFGALAGGAFFASFFWFVIDLLACLGAIHFKVFSPMGYVWWSIGIFVFFSYLKFFYILTYSSQAEIAPESTDSEIS